MTVEDQINGYLESIPEPKQTDMKTLHGAILEKNPGCRLWFFDGRDERGKVVSNPNIGYGSLKRKYADGMIKDFFQVGISANSTGLSIYIMGIEDKTYLRETYAKAIGKATITGYCIKFKRLRDIDRGVLSDAIQDGIERTQA